MGHGRDLGIAAALLDELSVVVGGPFKVCYPSPALSQGALRQNEVMMLVADDNVIVAIGNRRRNKSQRQQPKSNLLCNGRGGGC